MPEGDTIHRAAARLRPALAGHAPRPLRGRPPRGRPSPRPASGSTDVEARGKHLLVHFERRPHAADPHADDRVVAPLPGGERWRKAAHLARAVIEADSGWVAVCFQAPVVETYHRGAGRAAGAGGARTRSHRPRPGHRRGRCTGVARRRARCTDIADVLLDQRIASGIGNVYKSEVLLPPRHRPVHALADVDRADVLAAALHHGAPPARAPTSTSSSRVTYRGGVAVYGRRGQPCLPVRNRSCACAARARWPGRPTGARPARPAPVGTGIGCHTDRS